jgi:putative N6-adenine-specific DNA methylase
MNSFLPCAKREGVRRSREGVFRRGSLHVDTLPRRSAPLSHAARKGGNNFSNHSEQNEAHPLSDTFEIFIVTAPGLETILREELVENGFRKPVVVPGGVTIQGTWPDVWRANVQLRGATRVLARIAEFEVTHLADLHRFAARVPWHKYFNRSANITVEAACKRSKIYHSDAAAERVAKAIQESVKVEIAEGGNLAVMVRIDKDMCTISLDTSGESLHKRGHKEAIAKAPLRENLAAMFLRQAGYRGKEPVVDPMCGSGTFILEAAEMATRLMPGRARSFAFQHFKTYDSEAFAALRVQIKPIETAHRFIGSDRDDGAIQASTSNAERAGLSRIAQFTKASVSELQRPNGAPGLVISNPPYGLRIGDKKPLFTLHAAFGKILKEKFSGWRVAIVTADKELAYATGLPFLPPAAPVNHGGVRVTLFQTAPLT